MNNKILSIILTGFLFLSPCIASAVTTWNPSDMDTTDASLSNGNLTVNATTNDYGTVRATTSLSAGSWYWELTFSGCYGTVSGIELDAMVGIATSSAAIGTNHYIGKDAYGWGWFSHLNGTTYTNSVVSPYGPYFLCGQTVGVAYKTSTSTLTFSLDGISLGTAYSGISGTMFPAVSVATVPGTITANFGATPFKYCPPSGYSGIDGSACLSGVTYQNVLPW